MSSPTRQGKLVPLAYGATALALLLVVATVALVVQPPAPPAVAEYAPQAAERIDDALKAQASRFGADSGGQCAEGLACGARGATTTAPGYEVATPTTRRTIVDKARVHRCVGDPPRQTEDPQSPPCINYWEGDNGGSTWKGVTRDEIRVAVPCLRCGPEDSADMKGFRTIADHFNRRYELYGRKIKLVGLQTTNYYEESPVEERAAAAEVDHELTAFASLDYDHNGDMLDNRPYYDELARRKIMSVGLADIRTSAHLRAQRPYQWTYPPSFDQAQQNLVEFICRSLAGKTARYAGPDLSTKTRSFAAVYLRRGTPPPDLSVLQQGLARCNAPLRVWEEAQDGLPSAMQEAQEAGITTVICICKILGLRYEISDAATNRYEPEWLFPGALAQDTDANYRLQTPDQQAQLTRAFGLSGANKLGRTSDEPWFWAVRETDPNRIVANTGTAGATTSALLYRQLLLLASGIQLAGPNLTPEAFERGLQRARFPNPASGQAPYFQARVGFDVGDYSMVDDFALVWFGPAANGDGTAGLCYVERGARWSQGQWTRPDYPFFTRSDPCR